MVGFHGGGKAVLAGALCAAQDDEQTDDEVAHYASYCREKLELPTQPGKFLVSFLQPPLVHLSRSISS